MIRDAEKRVFVHTVGDADKVEEMIAWLQEQKNKDVSMFELRCSLEAKKVQASQEQKWDLHDDCSHRLMLMCIDKE